MKRTLLAYRLGSLMTMAVTMTTPMTMMITVALAVPMALSAQDVQPPPASDFLDLRQGATEAELVIKALTDNPTLLAERQRVAMAEGDVMQARLRQNPSLSLGGLKEVNGPDSRLSIGGSLPLELFGRRALRTQVAESKASVTQESVADQERLLAAEVRARFGQALASIRDLKFAEQLLQINQDFLRLMQDRVREGATPALDADETRVEVNRVESMRIDYQARAEIALLALKEAVGMQPEESLRLKGELELMSRGYDQKELIQLAMNHRPDLAFQRANQVLAGSQLHQDRIMAKPDASIFAGYERPDSGFSQRAFDPAGNLRPIRQTFNYATFGLNLTLPVFNRNQGTIFIDTAAIQAARNQVAAVDLRLRHEVAQDLIRFDGAQARVEVYRKGVRDQAAHNLDVVRQTYGYGRASLLDVIAEQRRYIDIETGYTQLLLEVYAARIALEQAVGTSLP